MMGKYCALREFQESFFKKFQEIISINLILSLKLMVIDFLLPSEKSAAKHYEVAGKTMSVKNHFTFREEGARKAISITFTTESISSSSSREKLVVAT